VFLKTVFIIKGAASYYPSIRWLDYESMVTEWKIVDNKFESSSVDRIYIAVTKNLNKALVGVIPEKDMSRFQFYESIVRIA